MSDTDWVAVCPHDVQDQFIFSSLLRGVTSESSGKADASPSSLFHNMMHSLVVIPINSEFVLLSYPPPPVAAPILAGKNQMMRCNRQRSRRPALQTNKTCITVEPLEQESESTQAKVDHLGSAYDILYGLSIRRITSPSPYHQEREPIVSGKRFFLPFTSISCGVRDYSAIGIQRVEDSLKQLLSPSQLHSAPPPSSFSMGGVSSANDPRLENDGMRSFSTSSSGRSIFTSLHASLHEDLKGVDSEGNRRCSGARENEGIQKEETNSVKYEAAKMPAHHALTGFIEAQYRLAHRFIVADADRSHAIWALEISLDSECNEGENSDAEESGREKTLHPQISVVDGRRYWGEGSTSEAREPNENAVPLIGSGERGFRDGEFSQSQFHTPIALCWKGAPSTTSSCSTAETVSIQSEQPGEEKGRKPCLSSSYSQLFISDAGNHAIRVADFRTRFVRTIVGTHRIPGYRDGKAVQALLHGATAMVYSTAGLLFTDGANGAVRCLCRSSLPISNAEEGLMLYCGANTAPRVKEHSSFTASSSPRLAPDEVLAQLDEALSAFRKRKSENLVSEVEWEASYQKTQCLVEELRQFGMEAGSSPPLDPHFSPDRSKEEASGWVVWTVAGGAASSSQEMKYVDESGIYKDAPTPLHAKFGFLSDLAVVPDPSGGPHSKLYVCDATNKAIRVLSAAGVHTSVGLFDVVENEGLSPSCSSEWGPFRLIPVSLVRRKALTPRDGEKEEKNSMLSTSDDFATVYSSYQAWLTVNVVPPPLSTENQEERAKGSHFLSSLNLLLPVPQSFTTSLQAASGSTVSISLHDWVQKMGQLGKEGVHHASQAMARVLGEIGSMGSIDVQENEREALLPTSHILLDQQRHLRYWFPWVFIPLLGIPNLAYTLHMAYLQIHENGRQGGDFNPHRKGQPFCNANIIPSLHRITGVHSTPSNTPELWRGNISGTIVAGGRPLATEPERFNPGPAISDGESRRSSSTSAVSSTIYTMGELPFQKKSQKLLSICDVEESLAAPSSAFVCRSDSFVDGSNALAEELLLPLPSSLGETDQNPFSLSVRLPQAAVTTDSTIANESREREPIVSSLVPPCPSSVRVSLAWMPHHVAPKLQLSVESPLQRLYRIYESYRALAWSPPFPTKSSVIGTRGARKGMSLVCFWLLMHRTGYLKAPYALSQQIGKVKKAHLHQQVATTVKDCEMVGDDPRLMAQLLYRGGVQQRGYHVHDALGFKAFIHILVILSLWEEKSLVRLGELQLQHTSPHTSSYSEKMDVEGMKSEGTSTRTSLTLDELLESLLPSFSEKHKKVSPSDKEALREGKPTDLFDFFTEDALKSSRDSSEEVVSGLIEELDATVPRTGSVGSSYLIHRWKRYVKGDGVWEVLREEILCGEEKPFLVQQSAALKHLLEKEGFDEKREKFVEQSAIHSNAPRHCDPVLSPESILREAAVRIDPLFGTEEEVETAEVATNASMVVKKSEKKINKKKFTTAREEAVLALFYRLLSNEKPLWELFRIFSKPSKLPATRYFTPEMLLITGASSSPTLRPILSSLSMNVTPSASKRLLLHELHLKPSSADGFIKQKRWCTETTSSAQTSSILVLSQKEFFALWRSVGVYPTFINQRELQRLYDDSIEIPLLVPPGRGKRSHHGKSKKVCEYRERSQTEKVLHFIPFLESVVRLSLHIASSASPPGLESKFSSKEEDVSPRPAAEKLEEFFELLQGLLQRRRDSPAFVAHPLSSFVYPAKESISSAEE